MEEKTTYQQKLNGTWLKAAVLGATWAASEIILGSFLHNLRVPFKGNILTAIALVLLITASFKWKDKGLFWRSGLICALMKTMSPSAVIFGPMMAIFAEAILFDLSIRFIGRNTLGFIIGSALAMSWVFFQKTFKLLLYYGSNIVDIYENLLLYIERQIGIESDIFWLPLLILLGIYAAFGIFAAIVGSRIGKTISNSKNECNFNIAIVAEDNQRKVKAEFPHSILWLVLSFFALVFSLLLIGKAEWYFWLPTSVILLTVWVLRYKRGMRQLSKPKFWISFALITILAAVLITAVNGDENSWIDGLWMGLEMNVRAAIVIVGFSVLGTELYNPRIRNYLAKSAYKQASLALELAFETLPYVIGQLPDARTFLTQPGKVIQHLMHHAEYRLKDLNTSLTAKVIIITGGVEAGKTTSLRKVSEKLIQSGKLVSGFISPRIMDGDKTVAYSIENLKTGETLPFLSEKSVSEDGDVQSIGKYFINSETEQKAKQILSDALQDGAEVVVIDEVGRLELRGDGWHNELHELLKANKTTLVLSVRDSFVESVIEKFVMSEVQVISVENSKPDDILKYIKD